MTSRIIMPLPHKEVSTFDGPTWYFDEGIYLDTIYDEDFGAFHRDEIHDFYRSSINIHSICFYISNPIFDNLTDYVRRMATILKFVLNNFAIDSPIVVPYSALIHTDVKAHILELVEIDAVTNLHLFRDKCYRIRPRTDVSTVSQYYKIVHKCCLDNPLVLFSLERFNSSLIRSEILDKIVDITLV